MRAAELASLVLIVTLLSCMPGTPPTIAPEPKPSNALEVVIYSYNYKPPTLTVTVGSTVTWVNKDLAPHTVTYHSYGNDEFDSGNVTNGKQYTHRFRHAGQFDYICALHQGMQGTVIVKDTVAH